MPPQLAGYIACCNEKKVVQGCLTEFTERFAKDLDKLKAGVGGVYLRSVVANEQYHVDNAKKPFVSCTVYTAIGAGIKKNNCGRLGYVDVDEDLVFAEECNSDKASFAVLTKA